jgi:hypothetical protein
VIEEVVGLRFESIGTDRDNRVSKFGIFIAVVKFAHPHVAGRMDF